MLSQDFSNDDIDFQSQSQNEGFMSQDHRYNSQHRDRNDRSGGLGGSGAFSQGMQFSQVNFKPNHY